MAVRDEDSLTDDEIMRLRLLNQKLEDAQQWIGKRADRCLEDYFAAGGRHRHRDCDAEYESVMLNVEIDCLLRRDHPNFRPDRENVVATLWSTWTAGHNLWPEGSDDNWNEFRYRPGHRMQAEHHCWLMHDLCDHALHCDWDRILSIAGLRIDVQLTQRREISW